MAIEDSRWGIESAKTAGLRCVGITQTYGAGELASADAYEPAGYKRVSARLASGRHAWVYADVR